MPATSPHVEPADWAGPQLGVESAGPGRHLNAPDANSTSYYSSPRLEGRSWSWFEGVAMCQRQKQHCGGGAQGRAVGHRAHLVSGSRLVTDNGQSAITVRV